MNSGVTEAEADAQSQRAPSLLDLAVPFAAEDASAARRAQARLHFQLAAVLFFGGGLGAILPDLLFQPQEGTSIFLLPLLAMASGVVVWLLSSHLPRRALHVVAMVATLEVALTVAFADSIFAIYFTFVAIYAAYVFISRRAIAFHVAFTSLAAFAPLVYDPDQARESLIQGLVLVPTLILAAGTVAFLRERLAASEARYRHLSECDPLTGVGNYRRLGVHVPGELRRHMRFGRPLALFVIDLDDFKRINDSYGHQRGDALLQEVGRALSAGVRDHDIVVRQGGDEFAVVAPETDREAANLLGERLRQAVGEIAADGNPIGASMGCAYFPDDADTLEGLLAAADARLRDAKGEKPRREERLPGPAAPASGEAPASAAGETAAAATGARGLRRDLTREAR